jgi:hypothetical protein
MQEVRKEGRKEGRKGRKRQSEHRRRSPNEKGIVTKIERDRQREMGKRGRESEREEIEGRGISLKKQHRTGQNRPEAHGKQKQDGKA